MLLYYTAAGAALAGGPLLARRPQYRRGFLLAAGLCCWLLASLRYVTGFDYRSYETIFRTIAAAGPSVLLQEGRLESGYVLLNVAAALLGGGYRAFLFLFHFILTALVFAWIERYSPSPWMSVYLFVTLQYLALSMNLLRQAKFIAKTNPDADPYRTVYGLLPDCAAANPAVKQQYINGHFCYAQKAGVLTNGLGIVRHIAFFDNDFKKSHPEISIEKRTDNPDVDKEIGDSRTLLPVLRDFYDRHPGLRYETFLGDAAFDSYELYGALLGECGFQRAVIPINPRGVSSVCPAELNEHGIPLCPRDGSPLAFHSICRGKNRSMRFKFICPKAQRIKSPNGVTWRCRCDQPCSSSSYGRCVYIYPDADKRLYPGILRDSDLWRRLYRQRISVERSIGSFKSVLGVAHRKTANTATPKADLFLAGIVQLLCVLLADALHDSFLFRRVRRLAA